MDVAAAPQQLLNHRAGFPELRRLSSMKGGDPLEGDFLAIDDLLDFSNEDIGGPIECSQLEYTTPQTTAFEGAGEELTSATTHEATSSITMQAAKPAAEKPASGSSEATPSVFSASMEEPGHLCVPCDDLADLEWLSNFVEESFSSGGDDEAACMIFGTSKIGVELEEQQKTIIKPSISTPQQQQQQHRSSNEQRGSPVSVLEISSSSSSNNYNNGGINAGVGRATSTTAAAAAAAAVPSAGGRAARSKRPRSAVCFWNTRILSADASSWLTENNNRSIDYTSASSTLTLSSEPSSDSETPFLNFGCSSYSKRGGGALNPLFNYKLSASPKKLPKPTSSSMMVSKKKKKKKQAEGNEQADGGMEQTANGRRCLHCGSQKTPQWRAGPMGPKTLCNACGVRYKSGRLLPEYRPAASPTFVESIHSNSHRRVLEMRKKRLEDGDGDGEDEDSVPYNPAAEDPEDAPSFPRPPFSHSRNPSSSSSAHHHLSPTSARVSCA